MLPQGNSASFLGSSGILWRGQEDTPMMWHSLPWEYSARKSLNPCCRCLGEPGSGAACLPRLLIFILPGVIGYSKQPFPLRRETSDIFIYTPLQVSNCCMTITSGRHLTQKPREIPAEAKSSSRMLRQNPNLRTAPGSATRPKPSQRKSQCLGGGL